MTRKKALTALIAAGDELVEVRYKFRPDITGFIRSVNTGDIAIKWHNKADHIWYSFVDDKDPNQASDLELVRPELLSTVSVLKWQINDPSGSDELELNDGQYLTLGNPPEHYSVTHIVDGCLVKGSRDAELYAKLEEPA